MNKIKKLLCMYVALMLLVSNTLGVSVAAALPKIGGGTRRATDLTTSKFGAGPSTCDPHDPNSPCSKNKSKGKGTHGNQQTAAAGEEEEEGDGSGGCEDGSCDGGGGGGSGGGGGGGLGGMLGQMMQSLLPLLLMMMMMQQNKNNQQPTPAALATVPPTFTPIQLFTAVPSATRAPAATIATSPSSNSESTLFPTLPPMN